jgi:DNA-binding beta-propeller fold protein YncE
MWLRKKSIIVLLCLIALPTTIAQAAKSVFIISKHAVPSQAQAYAIDGDQVTYQAQVDIDTYNPGYGAVGNGVWPEKELMFVTFEGSPMIVWPSTKTLEKVGEFDTGVNNPAGITVDSGNARIYVVDRGTDDLYVYSFDEVNNTLVFQAHEDLLIADPYYSVTGYGLALDEVNGLLYVSNATEYVEVFRTSDWGHDHYIKITVDGTVRDAVGIAVDPTGGYLYTGACYYGGCPAEGHTLLVRTETT